MASDNEKIISLNNLKYFLGKLKNIFIVKKDDNCGSSSKPIYLKDGELVECEETSLTEVAYAELKGMRDNGGLIAGHLYRITDYNCTTLGALSAISSANHQFDIIVEAISNNKLSKNAKACNHKFIEREPNSLGVVINYSNDFYYVAEGWKSWEYDNLPENLKKIINTETTVKRQLFQKNLKAGELRIKVATRCHRNNSKNSSYTYEIPCLGVDLCTEIDENNQATWNDYIISSDYHRYVASTPGSMNNDDIRHENTEVEYVLNVPKDGTYTICIAVDDTNDILMNASNPLRSELGVYGEMFEFVEKDPFVNSNLEAWELKYDLDNDTDLYQWANIDPSIGRGVIYYMKDEYGNECPYDFKNILFNGYYTFTTEISNIKYDSTVRNSWCHGNIILPAYNVYGTMVLNKNIFINNQESNVLCAFNKFGFNCTDNKFGNNCSSNTFGNYCVNNEFGTNCLYNTFADYCQNNRFYNYCQSNTIGVVSTNNSFGSYIIRVTLGKQCTNCKISNSAAGDDVLLSHCRVIKFGDQCSNVNLYSTKTTSPSQYLQNIEINTGVSGSVDVSDHPLMSTSKKIIARKSDGNITQYIDGELSTTSLVEVTSNPDPKVVLTNNTIAVNTSNGKVFFGVANKGWWFVTAQMLGNAEVIDDTLLIQAEYNDGTISMSGEVKDGTLIL